MNTVYLSHVFDCACLIYCHAFLCKYSYWEVDTFFCCKFYENFNAKHRSWSYSTKLIIEPFKRKDKYNSRDNKKHQKDETNSFKEKFLSGYV